MTAPAPSPASQQESTPSAETKLRSRWRPDKLSIVLVIISCLGLLFYFNTAVITGGGGPGETLAFKPMHGVYPFYSPVSGEEWAWRALEKSPNPPWWVKGDYVRIYYSSTEVGWPLWLLIYRWCYYGAILCLLGGLGRAAFSFMSAGRSPMARDRR